MWLLHHLQKINFFFKPKGQVSLINIMLDVSNCTDKSWHILLLANVEQIGSKHASLLSGWVLECTYL